MKKIINRKIIKLLLPFLLIIVIWSVFSGPYLLQGKVPFPSTYLVNFFSPWNAYPEYASPIKNNAMPDVIGQIFPWKSLVMDVWKDGSIPLWNPYSFSGTPLLANYQSAVFSPFNLLYLVLPFIDAWSLIILFQPLLAGLFTYLFVRSLKVSKWGSLVSAISFMFCGFITSWMAYGTLGYAILFLPLALLSVEKFLSTEKKHYLLLLAFSIAFSFFSGHFQISIYFFLFLLAYVIYRSIKIRQAKKFYHLFSFLIIGLLFSLPQILPSLEFYSQSFRSEIFQKLEAIPLNYLPTLFAPDYFGNPVTRNDWFGHYAEWNGYLGLIPLFLAIYAIKGKKNTQTLFFLFIGVLSMILAFNNPILNVFVNLHIPVISTSAASRIIVIFSFTFAVLAGFGLDLFIKDIKEKRTKKIFSYLTVFFLIFIFFWLVPFINFLADDKSQIAKKNLILPTLIFLTFAFSSLIFLRIRNKLNYLIILVILLVSFDMIRFSTKWMPFESRSLVFPEVSITQELSKLSKQDRYFGNFGAELNVFYKVPSLEGYDPLYIRRYGEFIASLDNGEIKDSPRSVVSYPRNGKYSREALNFLNVRYVIHKFSDGRNVWTFPFWEYPKEFKQVYKDDKYEIYENLNYMPRAYLVSKYSIEKDKKLIIDRMFNKLNLNNEIILEEEIPNFNEGEDIGNLKAEKIKTNYLSYLVANKNDNLFFISNPIYKDWNAYLDGKQAKIYRSNYAFMAISVPPGNHKVELKYEPKSFYYGLIAAGISLLGGLIFIFYPRTLIPGRKTSSSQRRKDK